MKSASFPSTLSAIAIAAFASSAANAAGVTFYSALNDTNVSPLISSSNQKVESRFRVDVGNWDTRLEFDSYPDNGDTTGHISNSKSFFENQTFQFDMSFVDSTDTVSWKITKGGNVVSNLSQVMTGFNSLNTIQMFTAGSRAGIDLENVTFSGLGLNVTNFPDIDTSPNGPTFVNTYGFFGNNFNLLAGDWSLTGDLTVGTFQHRNPSERAKLTIKLRDSEIPAPPPVIPAPSAAAGAIALMSMLATRRRRK